MKILFLDIDGVLNSYQYMISSKSMFGAQAKSLDPNACLLLEEIIVSSGCKVVLSSSWRKLVSFRQIESWIRQRGCPSIEIIDKTPSLGGFRGEEIQAWLFENSNLVDKFVIVDDDSDMGELSEFLVQTSFEFGLTKSKVQEIIGRFNG